jgi:cell wall-associated NlpC family hydrolase
MRTPTNGRRRGRRGDFLRIACVAVALLPAAARADPPAPEPWLAAAAGASAASAAARVWHDTRALAHFALGLIGVNYRWGGETPERGLDCSGLIRYVFQQVVGVTLPRTSRELARVGERVQLADLQVGDLVFFNTRRFAFSHVGIYLGDSRFIHAPARGREVEVSTLSSAYWQKRFDGARRLAFALPSLVPAVVAEAAAAPAAAPPADDEADAPPQP